ncbi:PH domain-containing protein [Streptomyces sp. NPDC102360]|uniref:PH domain-containing protein n=1 Tax=Streptomyces sp. NPDC102360 TaxID=3366160 RepID=UPI0037F223A5
MYKGHNGTIEIHGDQLVLTRTGAGARISRQTVKHRNIPLAAISSVDLVRANIAKNGRLRLGLGGQPLPTLDAAAAASEPNTVIFTHGQRHAFGRLYDYLRSVTDHNDTHAVDCAAAYAQCDDALHTHHNEKATKMAARIGTAAEREDILRAAARLNWTLGSKREIKKLPEHLTPGETVHFMASGNYDDATGLVVLTDRRVLMLRHGFTGSRLADFPLERISSVQTSSTFGLGTLTIHVSGNISTIKHISTRDLGPLADAIRTEMGRITDSAMARTTAPAPTASPAPPAPQADVFAQITKLSELHAARIIDDTEFQTKKAELLTRL